MLGVQRQYKQSAEVGYEMTFDSTYPGLLMVFEGSHPSGGLYICLPGNKINEVDYVASSSGDMWGVSKSSSTLKVTKTTSAGNLYACYIAARI